MKRMFVFITLYVILTSFTQNNVSEYKIMRHEIIEKFLIGKINNTIKIKPNNKNKERELLLDFIIVSINTNDTIINEFGNKEIYKTHKRIYSKKELDNIKNYKFISANFIDVKTKKTYQVTYTFNHKDFIKNISYQICYKIKNVSGKKRKLNYLHITTN